MNTTDVLIKGQWMGETEIVRLVHPGKRDSEISYEDYKAVIDAVRASGAESKNIGWNEYVWRLSK